MSHEPILINPPRKLNDEELSVLKFLLSQNFKGKEKLVSQIQSVRVSEECKDCRSITLVTDNNTENFADVHRRVPIEAQMTDDDGIDVHILLHVVEGFLDELEIYREDLQQVTSKLDITKFTVFNPDMP